MPEGDEYSHNSRQKPSPKMPTSRHRHDTLTSNNTSDKKRPITGRAALKPVTPTTTPSITPDTRVSLTGHTLLTTPSRCHLYTPRHPKERYTRVSDADDTRLGTLGPPNTPVPFLFATDQHTPQPPSHPGRQTDSRGQPLVAETTSRSSHTDTQGQDALAALEELIQEDTSPLSSITRKAHAPGLYYFWMRVRCGCQGKQTTARWWPRNRTSHSESRNSRECVMNYFLFYFWIFEVDAFLGYHIS